MNKKICCVNDMPGVGKIALSAMIPILSKMGVSVTCLPTALVSNTLDFGLFEILDTSDYMEKTVEVWKKLGFDFDCIATGFMVNPRQIEIIKKLIRHQKKVQVVVDPIMGDEGKLYNGMNEENVKIMRELASLADILIPNYTEACFLCDKPIQKSLSVKEAQQLVSECRGLNAKSVVITSAVIDEKPCVIGYDADSSKFFTIDYERIDVHFPGTGDIFSAVLIGDLLSGKKLYDATAHAMHLVSEMILASLNKQEKFEGVDIERFISKGLL